MRSTKKYPILIISFYYYIQDNNILVMCMHIHDNLDTRKKYKNTVHHMGPTLAQR